MTIRLRFYAILATIAGLMLLQALGSGYAVHSAQELVYQLYSNALLPSLELKTMSDGYTNAGIVSAVRVRTGDLSWEEGEALVRRTRDQLKPAWADYISRNMSEAEHTLVRRAEVEMVEADAALDELTDILAGQDVAGLTAFIARVMYPSIKPLLAVIERLAQQQDQFGQALYAASDEVIHKQQLRLAILLSIAVVAFLGAVYTTRFRVVRPLGEMTAAMSAVAGGALDHPVPSTERSDEIGALAQALERFRDNARQIQENERELRLLTVALSEARDKAEEATQAKSSFLAMMSHEIRTPMNGVMSMAEMLDATDLTEDQHSMSAVIRQSAAALLTIINDILDFSKIEAGRLEIERVPFSLAEVVEGAAELVGGRAEDHGLELVVDIDPILPDRREGDPTRIRQILLNLIGNAVKFTEHGGITLTVASAPSPSHSLRFEVTDTGIGLSEEQCGRLFQAFVQADSSTARKYGGTGLGLSISQRLCQMMGGAIGVTSQPGIGSTFWFELPLPTLEPAPPIPAVAIADARIVAAGFTGAARTSLARHLAAAGIAEPVWAGLAAETTDLVRQLAAADQTQPKQPVIVLVAATGHNQHGFDLARSLTTDNLAGVPVRVILVAARGLVSSLAEADRAGVFATLTLPLRRRRLWHTLAATLGRVSLTDRTSASDDGRTMWEPPPIEQARAAEVLILVAEDNPTNQIVIHRLLNQRGYAHEIGANGLEALELLKRGGYGLLLTDFHMPEMDGFQLTATIRAAEVGGTSRLPIVALTADALPGTEQQCLAGGMDGYLTKPIDSRALTAILEQWLPAAAPLRQVPTPKLVPTPAPAMTTIDSAIFDCARLAEIFGELGPEARAFLASFLADVPSKLATLDQALAAGDSVAARDAAHALKGAARSIGAVRLGQVTADVQDCLDGGDPDTAGLLAGLLEQTYLELKSATGPLKPQ
ncbi:histidine kinase [uncultured Gammaproteobacteria bacterium]